VEVGESWAMVERKRDRSFGISIEPTWRIGYCVELAKLAEKLGFSTAWVPDGGPAPPYSDAIVTLSAIAASTNRIRLGSAIVNFYTRNPAWIASSFSALSDLASGSKPASSKQRMILGLGGGSPYNVSKFGIHKRSGMLADLREAVESIRELFEGKEVTVLTDHYAIEGVSLSKLRKRIPIHIGAAGPKMLRLAGEIADGVILTDRVASDLERSIEPVILGIGTASRRRSDLQITNSVVISVDESRSKALNAARATCAYLVAWTTDEKAQALGFGVLVKNKIASFINAGDEGSAGKLVDEKMIASLTVSGTVEDCIEKCREHLSHDIDHLAFCEPFGPKPESSISRIAKELIPKL